MNNLLMICQLNMKVYTLFWMPTWESNICFSFSFFLSYICIYCLFNINFYVILLYFIRMKMMKYDITLLI